MHHTPNSPHRLRLRDAAASFGYSYDSLYRAVLDGDLPAIKHHNRWTVRPEDVEAWITDNGVSNQP